MPLESLLERRAFWGHQQLLWFPVKKTSIPLLQTRCHNSFVSSANRPESKKLAMGPMVLPKLSIVFLSFHFELVHGSVYLRMSLETKLSEEVAGSRMNLHTAIGGRPTQWCT